MSDGKKNWLALYQIKVELKLKMQGFESPRGTSGYLLVGKLEEVVVFGKVDIVTYIYFNGTRVRVKIVTFLLLYRE